jgi:hypothetical protein
MAFLWDLLVKNIQNAGVPLPSRPALNFTGGGYSLADDPINNATLLTLTGGSGSGGGATVLNANFIQPSVGSTVTATVLSSLGAVAGNAATVGSGGYYLTNSVIDSTHVQLLNAGGAVNASPTATVTNGSVVTFGGSVLPNAAQAPGLGTVPQNVGGVSTPVGHVQVVNSQQLGVLTDGGTTDNWLALQTQLDRFANSPQALYELILDVSPGLTDVTGRYGTAGVSKPLIYAGENLTLRGVHAHGYNGAAYSSLQNWSGRAVPFWSGPLYCLNSIADPAFSINAGINYVQLQKAFLNALESPGCILFSEQDCGSLRGSAQLCFELFYNYGNVPSTSTDYIIASSYGNITPGIACSQALRLYAFSNGTTMTLKALITTTFSGSVTIVASTTLPANAYIHIAATYDGSTFRLFQAGVLVASAACTGTIVQHTQESFCLANENPIGMIGFNVSPNGPVDNALYGSVRCRDLATYTSAFTAPTTELTALGDGHTLFLFNFGSANRSTTQTATSVNPGGRPGFIVAQCSKNTAVAPFRLATGSPVWYCWHGTGGTAYFGRNKVKNINFLTQGSGAIFYNTSPFGEVDACSFSTGVGIIAWSFSFFLKVTNCLFAVQTASFVGMSNLSACIVGNSEGLRTERNTGGGGTWCIIQTLNGIESVGDYLDIAGEGTFWGINCLPTIRDAHWYNENGATGCVSYCRFTACPDVSIENGLIGAGDFPAFFTEWGAGPAVGQAPTFFHRGFVGGSPTLGIYACDYTASVGAGYTPLQTPMDCDPGMTSPVLITDPASPAAVYMPTRELASVTVTLSGSTYTMPQWQAYFGRWNFVGALSGDCTVTVPNMSHSGRERCASNRTTGGHNIIISSVTVGNNKIAKLVCEDGATWLRETPDT